MNYKSAFKLYTNWQKYRCEFEIFKYMYIRQTHQTITSDDQNHRESKEDESKKGTHMKFDPLVI